jgi:leucyl-tRNA synthetase
MSDTLSPEYNPAVLETKWQHTWKQAGTFQASPPPAHTEHTLPGNTTEPFYVLEMFPYPSGDLHMGHVRNYTIGDVFARFAHMQGKQVLHPMGWDALGLPAENQAIVEKVAPQVRTPRNIAQMKAQMERLGLAYDWSREIATYKPEYYRWNQWFFIQLYEKGLIYRRQSTVNFCPGCNTVIANEQVRDDGTCWRGHQGVTTREIPEWAFKITHYAEELLSDLDTLTQWPDRIVAQQRHWIGKSTGAHITFALEGHNASVSIFTTRVDTIYGCTYIALAPEHPLVESITTPAQQAQVQAFVQSMRNQDSVERTSLNTPKQGVFTGCYAIHPFTQEKIPVWIANFVLANYGTGAVMAVPAHDTRDFAFAQQYGLPMRVVLQPLQGPPLEEPLQEAFTENAAVINSGIFNQMSSEDARTHMCAHAEEQGFGTSSVQWHLRDWGFSRQRYWGTPIPIVYCPTHGAVSAPLDTLPIVLPDFEDIELTGQGGAPLAKLPAFYETTCPVCQGPAKRETETMDTFVDSAWYFARYLSPQDTTQPFCSQQAKKWLPVDVYIGGPEHAVMHLLYFRFWTKAMRDLGLVDIDEPVRRLVTQGMVNAVSYKCSKHGYVAERNTIEQNNVKACPHCQQPLAVAVEKMSKSKYNGVDPMDLIQRYGADTARLYTLFAAPPEKDLEWNPDGVEGLYRFVTRVYRVLYAQVNTLGVEPTQVDEKATHTVRKAAHRTLHKVTDELASRNHFNTAIAAMMEFVNTLYEHHFHDQCAVRAQVRKEVLELLAHMLAPFAPHLAEEMWQALGHASCIALHAWPQTDAHALQDTHVSIAVQINGKLRANIEVDVQATQADVEKAAQTDVNVTRHLEGKTVKKCIYVPGRLLNFVVA